MVIDLDRQDDGDALFHTRFMQANKRTNSSIHEHRPSHKEGSSGAYYALVGRFLSLSKLLKATRLLAYIATNADLEHAGSSS